MESQYYDSGEIEIDLIDLCREFLKHTKWIIIAAVVGLLLGLGYEASRAITTPATPSEKLDEVRSNLSAHEIQYVENLYGTYTALNQSIKNIQDQMVYLDVADDDFDLENCAMKMAGYIVNSDLFGVSDLFTAYLLSQEEYVNISQILYGSADDVEKANRRVSIWMTGDSRAFWDGTGNITEGTFPDQILNIRVIADSGIKADRVLQYIENCITRKQAQYAETGVNFTITKLDERTLQMQDVILSSIYSKTDSLAKDLYTIENQVSTLNNNHISKLSGDSKTYYELLSGVYKAENAESRKYAKYGILGLLAGLFAALAVIAVRYFLSNTVKTASELSWLMKGDMPYDLSVKGKKGPDENAGKLIAEDILIREKRDGVKKLYVIADEPASKNEHLAGVVEGLRSGAPVSSGDPLVSSEELRRLSEADSAVIALTLKHAKRDDIAKLEQYCRNYNVKILGVVAL